jgi:hypothetical protein
MRFRILFFVFCFSLSSISWGQVRATQPTIIVVPSDKLMNELGYLSFVDNQGVEVPVPDYRRAIIQDDNLKQVISKIGELFSDRGFPLVDLEATLRTIQEERADDLGWTSREGAGVAKSPIDEILARAKPDIRLDLDYEVNRGSGPFRYIEFNIQAIDAYSRKQVGAAGGKGPNTTETADYALLEEAVLSHIQNLQTQMQAHFDDQRSNGREIYMRVQVFSDSDIDLEEEFDDYELNEIIDDWMKRNTVNGTYNQVKLTENEVRYAQVRIPLFDEEGYKMDAGDFAKDLRRYLSKNYDISIKNVTQRLGDGHLIIRGLK